MKARFSDIVTERLVLRRLLARDAEPLVRYRSDPEVARFQSWEPRLVVEIRRFIDGQTARDPHIPGSWYQIGIALRETDELVGDIGLHVPAHEPRQLEFGITVAPEYQSRGIASEALLALLGYVFDAAAEHRIFASVDPLDHRSIALMRRLGMRQEAHFLKSLWFKGDWADEIVFGMLAREWRARQPAGRPAR